MSYCRWSSDSFRCDLYCYEDVHGGWTTHVAGRRRVMPDDFRDPWSECDAKDLQDEEKFKKVWEGHQEFMSRLDEFPFEELSLPGAGKTYNDPTLEDFRARVASLLDAGFNGRPGLLEDIDAEIAETGGDHEAIQGDPEPR